LYPDEGDAACRVDLRPDTKPARASGCPRIISTSYYIPHVKGGDVENFRSAGSQMSEKWPHSPRVMLLPESIAGGTTQYPPSYSTNFQEQDYAM